MGPGQRFPRGLEGGLPILRSEHLCGHLIAQGIGVAGGGVELVDHLGLPLPPMHQLCAQLPQQGGEGVAAQVPVFCGKQSFERLLPHLLDQKTGLRRLAGPLSRLPCAHLWTCTPESTCTATN